MTQPTDSPVSSTDPEKVAGSFEDDSPASPPIGHENRAVAFGPAPDDDINHEYRHTRPKGVEMNRVLTQEDKELAAAGYDHLDQAKKVEGKDDQEKVKNVDITEHMLSIIEIPTALGTRFEPKDPGASLGLTKTEAEERLKSDGPNALTPPKKKTALQKVLSPDFLSFVVIN